MWVDPASQGAFAQALARHDLPPWLAGIRHFNEVASTMDVARDLVRGLSQAQRVDCPPSRAQDDRAFLVTADLQTSGRGRRGAPWIAPAGKALMATLLLRPDADVAQAPLYGLAAAIAVARAAEALGVSARTKWPNDVWASGRKLAGVLVETAGLGQRLSHVAIGIGVNVNQSDAELPPVDDPPPTSLLLETGREADRARLCALVLNRLADLLGPGLAPESEAVVDSWRTLDLCLGRWFTARGVEGSPRLLGRDVASDGALLAEDEAGRPHSLTAGQISIQLSDALRAPAEGGDPHGPG